MVRQLLVLQLWSLTLMALLSVGGATRAHAQPPPDDPNDDKPAQMCGTTSAAHPNGETFTVSLPARNGPVVGPLPLWQDFDDKQGPLWAIDADDVVPGDTITLPKGCRIYAFLLSGWGDNKDYDQIIFYKLAEWVAQRNGYVHVGWWNNLTAPYMERPLHDQQITLTPLIGGASVYSSTPGTTTALMAQGDAFEVDLPKANPDEDFQFVNDFKRTLEAVRNHNPDAFIIVAGHSMGADAIVHTLGSLSQLSSNQVDLVALIDPVGNRDRPFKPIVSTKYQWTRWRATHNFRGWKKLDCERLSNGSCKPYGFFNLSVSCVESGGWLNVQPGLLAGGDVRCPGSVEDTGPVVSIGRNVRHLYHRWQHEEQDILNLQLLFDFQRNDRFNRSGLSTDNILSPNFQAAATTCVSSPPLGYDFQDDRYKCVNGDGHSELVGYRKKSDRNHEIEGVDEHGRAAPGLKMWAWVDNSPETRRDRLIALANLSPANPNSTASNMAWPYRPINPDLCLVCDDMIEIANYYLDIPASDGDTIPPASLATTNPDANAQGWFKTDVVVSVDATDAGSGVESIELTLSGASTGSTTTAGNSAETTVTAVGLTTVSHYARDVAGNSEAASTLDIRIDKTPPDVNGLTDPLPNAHGWFGSPVVVSFTASDEAGGSGLATSPAAVSVDTEGSAQEIVGVAEDNAGNITSHPVTLNIDLTPPGIVASADIPPNGNGWNNTDVRVSFDATDALSGLASNTPETVVSTEGANQQIVGTATDRAGHTASASMVLNIDKTAPQITAAANVAPNINGWNSGDVVVSFAASDALSGLVSSPADVNVSTEGAAQSIARSAEDLAGNTASASLLLNIDKTAPLIAFSSRTPANGAGWNNSDVTVAWTCNDAVSGTVADQVSQSLAAEGAGQNAVGTCADRAGHTASDTQSGINIDKTSPANQIATPAHGAAYELNASVTTAYSCVDTLSGVSSCAGPVPSGAALDTATVGAKTFTVSSTDAAGNPGVTSHAYAVQYAFSGFSNPIAALPGVNKANAGRTVPVKYSLRDANGVVIADLTSFESLVSAPATCETNVPTADAEESDAAGSTTIEFESGEFIYRWKTQPAWTGTCRVLRLTLTDGTQHTVAFQFK
jgi:hypothetical protein